MITIISGTNRKNSKSRLVSDVLNRHLFSMTEQKIHQVNLDEVSHDIYHPEMYNGEEQHNELSIIQDNLLLPSDKWIIVSPEYNGSIPGALKLFIDALSVRKYKETFKGRKVALVGVSSGRAGNLVGMQHLTGMLNYLGIHVLPSKLPISSIEAQVTESGNLNDATLEAISAWSKDVLEW